MKKKRVPAFLIGYLCFLAGCIAFWVFVISYVQKCLVRYEAAQPEYFVEGLTDRILSGGISDVFKVGEAPTRFESAEDIADYYDRSVQGKTFVWQRDKSGYDVSSPVYRLYADEEPAGVLTLREASAEPLMFILTLCEWEVAAAEPVLAGPSESVTVTVPEGYSVLVNEEVLGAEELTGNTVIPERFQYAREYVDVPVLVEYCVRDLFEKPRIKICDAFGEAVEYEEVYEQGRTQIVVDAFPASVMDPQLAAQVLENAERYTNFFSRDLPGCRTSVKPIADMFPKDSYYLELADKYRKEDMWAYSAHIEPTFENENVSEYIRYSDELFSCEISFDKRIVLKTGAVRVDTTHTRFFYGYVEGGWKILDMQTILDQG